MPRETDLSFDAPIPGMSLTTEPGNRPWEQPPRFSDVEDVIEHYIDRIGDESRTDEMLTILEQKIPVNMLVDTLVSAGVMEGVHTVEAGLLAAPVISEYVQAVADIEGVDYVVSSEDGKKGLSRAKTLKYKKMIEAEIQKEYDDEARNSLFMTDGEEPAMEEDIPAVPPPQKGLMSRPVTEVAPMEGGEE